jgi:hypothetical protein
MDDETVPNIPELSVADVAARLGTPNFFIFDNNGPGRWKRSHVPGAKNLNAYSFDRHDLPEDTSAALVFYCSGPG